MIRNHNIDFGEVPNQLADNLKIEPTNGFIINDNSNKNIINA